MTTKNKMMRKDAKHGVVRTAKKITIRVNEEQERWLEDKSISVYVRGLIDNDIELDKSKQ